MEDEDIKRLMRVLRHKNRPDLADLFKSSRSVLDVSSTFGSMWHSLLSTFEVHSSIQNTEKLNSLSKEDHLEVFNALLLVYPLKSGEPEISNIEYYPDFDLESEVELVGADSLKEMDFEYIQDQIKKCNEKVIEKLKASTTSNRFTKMPKKRLDSSME